MAISKELWVAYTRILFVESAYWIISIGMVFINEFVLSENVLTDDLTIFITIFQILFALAILLTLNYITKHYLSNPATLDNSNYAYEQLKETQVSSSNLDNGHHGSSKGQKEVDTDVTVNQSTTDYTRIDNVEDDHDRDRASLKSLNIKESSDRDVETTGGLAFARKGSVASSELSDQSQDSLTQLLIVNIPHRINIGTCKVVLPLSILYIGMLLLNNFCLKYVGVAFYFVSRSLTTVFNVIFTYVLINEQVSRGALICCGFIVLGFILGIDQESVVGSLSVIGVLYGVASSLFTSLFSIYTKKTLAKLERNIWTLILYNNINAIMLCTPLLIIHGDIQALISDKLISPTFWTLLSVSGVMAFFIGIVTNASIKYTSPLTHNISGTAKACLQTVIAVIYHHDHKSMLWWLSNITILVASASYSRIKQLEMEKRTATSSSRSHQQAAGNNPFQAGKFRTSPPPFGPKLEGRRDSSSSGCSATSEILFQKSSQAQHMDQPVGPPLDNKEGYSCSVRFQPNAN